MSKELLEKAKKNLTAEEVYENMLQGLEIGILDLQGKLTEEVDGLTQKQLRRCLKAIINYPEAEQDVKTEREAKFVTALYTLHQQQVQLEIQAIGQLQEELDKQREKEKENGVKQEEN
jgi:CII-binding regulator of phage lambda lysogenization HflD